jgi:hypothetical protein
MFKTVGMLRNYITFHSEALKAVENEVTWARVRCVLSTRSETSR